MDGSFEAHHKYDKLKIISMIKREEINGRYKERKKVIDMYIQFWTATLSFKHYILVAKIKKRTERVTLWHAKRKIPPFTIRVTHASEEYGNSNEFNNKELPSRLFEHAGREFGKQQEQFGFPSECSALLQRKLVLYILHHDRFSEVVILSGHWMCILSFWCCATSRWRLVIEYKTLLLESARSIIVT